LESDSRRKTASPPEIVVDTEKVNSGVFLHVRKGIRYVKLRIKPLAKLCRFTGTWKVATKTRRARDLTQLPFWVRL